MCTFHSTHRSESAASFVEFAIALPLLLLLIGWIFSLSLGYHQWSTLLQSVHTAGRTGVLLANSFPHYCEEPALRATCAQQTEGDTLTNVILKTLCEQSHLREQGLANALFGIQFSEPIQEGGEFFRVMKLSAQPGGTKGIFQPYTMIFGAVHATFLLERDCTPRKE